MPLAPRFAIVLALMLSSCAAPPAKSTAAAPQRPAPPIGRLALTFSVLPKSLQSNPELDMTVFTEMTPAGRKLVPASLEHPVYYVAQADGFKQGGHSVAGERPPPVGHIDYFVRRALGKSGYRSVPSSEVRPTLLILYRWGTHNTLSAEFSSDFEGVANADVLERARLVGGKKLVGHMARVMEWGDFLDRDEKRDNLKAQAADSIYYVVLFAYDFDAATRGEQILYWRTNMTVSSSGVSLRETLPTLIASATPFLGRDMTEPEFTSRKLFRREKIDLGPATVVGFQEDPVVRDLEVTAKITPGK